MDMLQSMLGTYGEPMKSAGPMKKYPIPKRINPANIKYLSPCDMCMCVCVSIPSVCLLVLVQTLLTSLSETGPTISENTMYVRGPNRNTNPTCNGSRLNCRKSTKKVTNILEFRYCRYKSFLLTSFFKKGCIVGLKNAREANARMLASTVMKE